MGLSPDALFEAVFSDVSENVREFSLRPFPGCTYKQFASSYLLESITRKFIPTRKSDIEKADAAAFTAFTSANNRCKDWQLLPQSWIDEHIVGEVRRELDNFLHPGGVPLIDSFFTILSKARPGPGVNVGAIGTSYYTKYLASPLSTTSEYLYDEYKRYCDWIPFLSEAEVVRYEKFGPPTITHSSRCSLVPKTTAVSRMICIEPSLNMYYQLGLATILEKRLKGYFGIDLKLQPEVNRRLAQQGSKDDSLCTIDLSSASDSVSLRLCETLFPQWFFELLLRLRSPSTTYRGQTVPLFMVSTMGNGFTFPLQTIIFTAILRACASICGYTPPFPIGCFGDDLICTKRMFPTVIRALHLLGFSENTKKTFFEGPFRESCGADWFYGQPVRPVFIRRLDSLQNITVTINQLNEWSAYTGIPLRNTISLLLSRVPKRFRLFVPFDSNNDEGIRVPLTLIKPKFNRNGSYIFRSYMRSPSRLRISEGTIRGPGRFGNLLYNPPGLYCSFLFGELVSFTISIRHSRVLYRSRLRVCPYWDYIPSGSLTNGFRLSWQQWETAVVNNIDQAQ